MDKLLALKGEEERDEQRFKETMAHRDHILRRKNDISAATKMAEKFQLEINAAEPQILRLEMEVKILDIQIEELTKNIQEKLGKVLKQENKLKKSKETFQNYLREQIEKTKETLMDNQNAIVPSNIQSNENEASEAAKRRVWALQGEIEALTKIEEYQLRKIEEIRHIISVVGESLVGEFEKNN